MDDPVLIRQALDRARACIGDADYDSAAGLLVAALGSHPAGEAPDAVTADAARTLAGVLATLGEPRVARDWAEYAYRAYVRDQGRSGKDTMQAASVLAHVLTATGDPERSSDLYADLIDDLRDAYGPASRQVLGGIADYASALHRGGDCARARWKLEIAYADHESAFGPGDREGIKMLARLGSMLRDCADFDGAHTYFDEAKRLCRAHLDPADTLARKVISLARSGADPAHLCGASEDRRADRAATAPAVVPAEPAVRSQPVGPVEAVAPAEPFASAERAAPARPAEPVPVDEPGPADGWVMSPPAPQATFGRRSRGGR